MNTIEEISAVIDKLEQNVEAETERLQLYTPSDKKLKEIYRMILKRVLTGDISTDCAAIVLNNIAETFKQN